MAHARIRKGLRGQSALVRSQFYKTKRERPTDPDKEFRQHAAKMAREALSNAVLWIDKKEFSWALVEAQRAVKLLEVAR